MTEPLQEPLLHAASTTDGEAANNDVEADEEQEAFEGQAGFVDVAYSFLQSATSWITTDAPDAPMLRGAGVAPFYPHHDTETAPSVPSAEPVGTDGAPDSHAESVHTHNGTPGTERLLSSRESFVRQAPDDAEVQPSGFAAAIETVHDVLDIEPFAVPYPEPPTIPEDTADVIAAAVEEFINPTSPAATDADDVTLSAAKDAGASAPVPIPSRGGAVSIAMVDPMLGGSASGPQSALHQSPSGRLLSRIFTSTKQRRSESEARDAIASVATGGKVAAEDAGEVVAHTVAPSPHPSQRQPPKTPLRDGSKRGSIINDVVVGLVNAVVAMPITAAYLPIVYSAVVYVPFLPLLTRLLFLANAAIQASVALLSSLPFAIGQVQDLGLIFLNAMTKDIAQRLEGQPPERTVATALIACSLSTALLGVCLMVVGRQRWGGLVAYIPLPVVAGYLGYLGYFCVAAALAQVTGLPISSPVSMALVFSHPEVWGNVLALVACSVVIEVTVHRWKSTAALPTVLLLVPLLWYATLLLITVASGVPWPYLMQWLQDHKWVEPPPAGGGADPFWKAFELYSLVPFSIHNVAWGVLMRQLPTMLVVCAVCSLGTSMDVMAVQAEVPWELNSDREITALGVGNLVAGLAAGGGPGSMIFSQSVLAIRSGVASRLQGLTVAAAQAAIFLLPVSLVHLLPNFYYGSLLAVLGVGICREWLWNTRTRISMPEFVISWLSFCSTLTLTSLMPVQGLEVGILVGIMMCAVHFAYEYSVLQLVTFTVSPSRSTAMLPFRHRQILSLFQGNVVAVSVSGYIFFGSMVEIGNRLRATAALLGTRSIPDLISAAGLDTASDVELEPCAAAATAAARRFLLLDMRAVVGIDATTATAFALLRRSLESRGVTMVITGLGSAGDAVRTRLMVNGVIARDGAWESGVGCPAFESFDAAVVWCEEHFMKVAAVSGLVIDLSNRTITLDDVIAMNLHDSHTLAAATARKSLPSIVRKLDSYLEKVQFASGDVLFDFGEPADVILLVLAGSLVSVLDFLSYTEVQAAEPDQESPAVGSPPRSPNVLDALPFQRVGTVQPSPPFTPVAGSISPVAPRAGEPMWQTTAPSAQGKVRLAQAGPGSILGALDFVLRRPRSHQCLAVTDGEAYSLSRQRYTKMARDDPHVHSLLQQMMLRSSLLTTATTQQAMERAVQCACPGPT